MHLIGLATICSCLLVQVSGRAAPRLLPRESSGKLESSPLPMPADTSSIPDANDDVTATSTATLNAVSSSTPTTSTTSVSATPTGPRNHNIAVAQNGTQFTPSSLKNIPIGDTLTFYFYPRNYSVVQSSFNAPCQPLERNAICSGFHPTQDNSGISHEKFVMTVTNAEPTWFYGVDGALLANGSPSVCKKGMAMVLNPQPKGSAGGQTLGTYKRNAANAELNGSKTRAAQVPDGIWGGEVRGISEKEKDRWESKHPIGGNVRTNATGVATAGGSASTSGADVATFENAGSAGKANSFMAIAVLVGTSVFGLRL